MEMIRAQKHFDLLEKDICIMVKTINQLKEITPPVTMENKNFSWRISVQIYKIQSTLKEALATRDELKEAFPQLISHNAYNEAVSQLISQFVQDIVNLEKDEAGQRSAVYDLAAKDIKSGMTPSDATKKYMRLLKSAASWISFEENALLHCFDAFSIAHNK